MSIAKYNKKNTQWDINTEGFEYHTLEELASQLKKAKTDHARLYGLFINPKGNYGDEAVAIIEDAYINLPKHVVEQVKAILADDEVVAEIKDGKTGIKPYTYEDEKHNKGTLYSVEFVDIE